MKRVLWFYSDKSGCGTYRTYFPAMYLQQHKLADVDLAAHRDIVTQWMRAEERAQSTGAPLDRVHGLTDEDYAFDVLVFQRAVSGPFPHIMRECRRRGVSTIFEMDDDLFNLPRTNPAKAFWERRDIQRDLRAQLDLADRVIVSTLPLAEVVAKEQGWKTWRDRITVCANHLHPDIWGEEPLSYVTPYMSGQTVIGWQGSTTHETDFMAAAPALATMVERYPQVHIRLFGSVPKAIQERVPPERRSYVKGVPFEAYPGTLRLLNFDIGIAPLTPCRFNDSKSNLKWLEYSALRVPCVASKVYPYATSIRQGETGFVADSQREWETYLSQLIEDSMLRKRIADAAFDDVWTRFSAEKQVPTWHQVLQALPERVAA